MTEPADPGCRAAKTLSLGIRKVRTADQRSLWCYGSIDILDWVLSCQNLEISQV